MGAKYHFICPRIPCLSATEDDVGHVKKQMNQAPDVKPGDFHILNFSLGQEILRVRKQKQNTFLCALNQHT